MSSTGRPPTPSGMSSAKGTAKKKAIKEKEPKRKLLKKFYSILMKTFNEIWTLLAPKIEYEQLKGKCRILWESFSSDKQDYVYSRIEEKKKRKEFVDYNPKFAIEKNSSSPRQQTMSFNDYYTTFGTTEERDGWKMVNPTGNKVIYVKGGPG